MPTKRPLVLAPPRPNETIISYRHKHFKSYYKTGQGLLQNGTAFRKRWSFPELLQNGGRVITKRGSLWKIFEWSFYCERGQELLQNGQEAEARNPVRPIPWAVNWGLTFRSETHGFGKDSVLFPLALALRPGSPFLLPGLSTCFHISLVLSLAP